MQHRKRAVALAVLVVAALIAVVLWHGHDDGAAPSHSQPAQQTAVTPSGGESNVTPTTIRVDKPPELDMSPDKIRRVLEDYKRDAIYPSWSRPLDPADTYKLKWNAALTSDLEMDDRPGQETLYRFDADRGYVMFGEAYTSWIEVWHKGERNHRVPLKIQANIVGVEQTRNMTLDYHDDGKDGDVKAGDLVYTNRFVPSSYDELKVARQVHIQAAVEAEGGATRLMTRDFVYTPRPPLEVESVTDAVVGGHLGVTLHVEVFEPGTYTLEANCFASDGETPISYVRQFFKLSAGKQTATLTFFGKIFHDKAVDGPYVIKDVRGFLRFLDTDENNLWFFWPQEHRTAAYSRSQFAPGEWDDQEKRDRIKGYEELLEQSKGH